MLSMTIIDKVRSTLIPVETVIHGLTPGPQKWVVCGYRSRLELLSEVLSKFLPK